MAANSFSVFGSRHGRKDLPSVDFERVRRENPIEAIIGAVVPLRSRSRKLVGNCPFHEDRTPSFTVYADSFHCFGCGAHGDVIDFLMRLHGVRLGEALDMLDGGEMPRVHIRRPSETPADEARRVQEAVAIWNAALPIGDTPAELYLRRRGITVPLPTCLRFSSLSWRRCIHPALVALISARDGSPQAIHRIFLNADGSKADLPEGKVKFSLGPITGGAIRLSQAGPEMVVCAGVEDGLSLVQMLGLPVWCATGDTALPSISLPEVARKVIVAHDADASGFESGARTAERYALEGRRVRKFPPLKPHKDFNQELQGVSL